MKSLLFACILALSFLSCNDDDKTITYPAAIFDSQITVDGTLFIPNQNTINESFITTGMTTGTSNERIFKLIKNNGMDDIGALKIEVTYPLDQSSVSGLYTFDSSQSTEERHVIGYYEEFSGNYPFRDGTITITDLGNNTYKLEFNTVGILNAGFENYLRTVTGYFTGTFKVLAN